MQIKGIVINRAKTIRKILVNKPIDKKYFTRLLQIYECRILGLCISRPEHSYQIQKRNILNENKIADREGGE